MNRILNIFVLLFIALVANSQITITGSFPALSNQTIKLVGFKGFSTYTIDSVKANKDGVFALSYASKDYGMGYLASQDNKSFIVILSKEPIKLEGYDFASSAAIQIIEGNQNKVFGDYSTTHASREQTLSAWGYLAQIYERDSLFSIHAVPQQAIAAEKLRINTEDKAYIAALDQSSYVSWYLPVRKLVSSVTTIAKFRPDEIPTAIHAFRALDYTDARLYRSGVFKEAIESQYWLIENSGRSLDSVFIEMNISIDHLIDNLAADEYLLNKITDHLFKFLEKRSLFKSAEYLALKVLNEVSCTINSDLVAQLESYRAMKVGNTAANFDFLGDVIAPAYQEKNIPKKLSELKSDYTLVVFGASWCPACPQELSELSAMYKYLQEQKLEVVFVSLDEDKAMFENFTSVFPFISMCSYKKWESIAAKDYHIFATPTMYLLNNKQEIINRPASAKHLKAYLEWSLTKKDK